MNLPLAENGLVSGLLVGFLFGLVLEGVGFGSPRKLTAQFTFRDFSVFKVMFIAVLVAAVGLWVLNTAGAMGRSSIYIPTLFLWPVAVGGLLIGAGFAVGGYCPGTCVAGIGSGRVDGIVFAAGMIGGVGAFAALFDRIEPFYRSAQGPKGQTLDQLLGLPVPVVLAMLSLLAAVGFWLGGRFERKHGGPLRAEALVTVTRVDENG